jgi:hypothetical protein
MATAARVLANLQKSISDLAAAAQTEAARFDERFWFLVSGFSLVRLCFAADEAE